MSVSIAQCRFHCNACYGDPQEDEGCFTTDVDGFMKDKEASCLDGTWGEFDDDGNPIPDSTGDIKPEFHPNPLYNQTNYEKAVKIYEEEGQQGVFDAVNNCTLTCDSWEFCEPCECSTPFDDGICLVCGS